MKCKINPILTLLLTLILSVVTLFACDQQGYAKAEILEKTDTMVVIKVSEAKGPATLLDAMTCLKDEGALTFELSGGMVTEIEGVANAIDWSASWMLYTSDKELSNEAWGTVEYGGTGYASAILGAEELPVGVGEYYIWVYTAF